MHRNSNVIAAVSLRFLALFWFSHLISCDHRRIAVNFDCQKTNSYFHCHATDLNLSEGDKNAEMYLSSQPPQTPNDIRVVNSSIFFLPSHFFTTFNGIKEFTANNCSIHEIYYETFSSAIKLNYLALSFNNIKIIPDFAFRNNSELQILKLDHNRIQRLLTNSFGKLNSLKTLSLSFNQIRYLPLYLFHDMESLESLELNDNMISVISAGQFATNGQLTLIDLHNNELAIIDNGAFDDILGTLQQLDLHHNTCVNGSLQQHELKVLTKFIECCSTSSEEMKSCLKSQREEESEYGTWAPFILLFIFGNASLFVYIIIKRKNRLAFLRNQEDHIELTGSVFENAKSVELREKGNQEFRNGDFEHALLSYNEALRYAESKENLALAYANRSAIYLREKLYDECLLSIKWSKENEYPADKIQKLNEREEKCIRMKESEVKDPDEDPFNFFKLSYPANPKIPFIVDCLEMRTTEKYGRGIYATRDLRAGDIIAIDEPVVTGLQVSKHANCSNCDKYQQLNLIPCTKTANLMFCSTECRDKLYWYFGDELFNAINESKNFKNEVYSERKFGDQALLAKILKDVIDKKVSYSVFDFDWSNPNDPEFDRNQTKCLLSFPGVVGNEITNQSSTRSFAKALIFGWLMNYSCIANVGTVHADNKVFSYVIKPIKAGEQLFANIPTEEGPVDYMKMPIALRQKHTFEMGFKCDCAACLQDITPEKCRELEKDFVGNAEYRAQMAVHAAFLPPFSTIKLAIGHISMT